MIQDSCCNLKEHIIFVDHSFLTQNKGPLQHTAAYFLGRLFAGRRQSISIGMCYLMDMLQLCRWTLMGTIQWREQRRLQPS